MGKEQKNQGDATKNAAFFEQQGLPRALPATGLSALPHPQTWRAVKYRVRCSALWVQLHIIRTVVKEGERERGRGEPWCGPRRTVLSLQESEQKGSRKH